MIARLRSIASIGLILWLATPATNALAGGLTFAHGYQEDSDFGRWARNFIECATSRSGIHVEMYPAGAVGRSWELPQRLLSGQIDMAMVPATAMERFYPGLAALSSPGLVTDPDALARVTSRPDLLRQIEKQLEGKLPLRLLGIGWSPGVLIGNDRIADLRGAKIRSFGMTSSVFSELGAIEVQMSSSEVPSAVRYGVLDGAVVSLDMAESLVAKGGVDSIVLAEDFSPFTYPLLLVINGQSAEVFGHDLPEMVIAECDQVTFEFNAEQAARMSALVATARGAGVTVVDPDELGRAVWNDAFEKAWQRSEQRGRDIRTQFHQLAPPN